MTEQVKMDKNKLVKSLTKKILMLLIWGILITLIFFTGLYNQLLFHTGVELYTIIVAFIMFFLALNTYEISQNSFLTFLGLAFGFVAILDCLHMITYRGINIFSNISMNETIEIWIAARSLQSISILLSFIFLKRKLNMRIVIPCYIAFILAIMVSIYYFKWFPICYIDNVGLTEFNKIVEYFISAGFIASIVLLIKFKQLMRYRVYRYMLLSLITAAIGEIMLSSVNSNSMLISGGHIFKLLSYTFIYTAIVATTLKNPLNLMFYELQRVKDELAEKNLEIISTNNQLKQDITDLQMVERLLRKSKAWSRAIFEGSSIGIVLLNINGVIIEANPAFERIMGYNSEELRDLGIQNVTYPDDYEQDAKLFNDLINGKIDSYKIEKRYIRKDNNIIWGNLKMSFIQNTGEDFQFIIAMIEDITQRKQDEEKQHKLMKELETTNAELDNFAYIVSHDLKAPLRGIGSLASWLKKDYADKLDSEGQDIVNLITNRVERMKNFIDGILQYSRVSQINENKAEVNLNELVNEIVDFIALPANITLSIENELPVISGYKLLIEQIFQNLISNSIKFMDKSKGIIKIASREEDGLCTISVTDNGAGIDEKYHKKIFQIFQTLQPRDKFESTGIGLSIVKKIVEKIGGSIWVESELGKGSTFYFTLPKE